MFIDKITKWLKRIMLTVWALVLAGSIYGWATNGTPYEMSWADIVCREGSIVILALMEVARDNNLF